jgi:hypothetical protein
LITHGNQDHILLETLLQLRRPFLQPSTRFHANSNNRPRVSGALADNCLKSYRQHWRGWLSGALRKEACLILTTEKMYEFDLRGFVIYPAILPKSMFDRMVHLLEGVSGAKGSGKFSFLELDPIFMEVLAYPPTIEILKVLLGQWLRFDHTFGIRMTSTAPARELMHNGLIHWKTNARFGISGR